MTLQTPFQFWTLVPLLLAAPVQTAFVLLYSIKPFGAGEWWKDFVGRALFIKAAALAYVLDASAWTVFSIYHRGGFSGISFDISTYRADYSWLLVIGYWLMLVAVVYQFMSLIKQRFIVQKRRM